jgi:SAM-dependent methyltransferase
MQSSPPPARPAFAVFDTRSVRRHRDRAAQLGSAEFLHEEIAERLADRLEDMARAFPRALDLAARDGVLARTLAGRGGIEELVECDVSARFLARPGRRVVADPEFLPFAPASFDLVLAPPMLHWTNDLPGALIQLRQALKPDGLLLGALFGGATLAELREALMEAELAEEDGVGPRVSPLVDLRDLGGLLQRAGFALPVLDSDRITVTYADALALMRDLRGMGEANAVAERRRGFSRRATLARAAAIYAERFPAPGGRVAATFEVLFFTGWAPHESQPKPLRPGSATTRLADALGTIERPAGDKAER